MNDTVDAVILGGGDGEAIVPGVAFKGMVEVAGKPMVQWVSEAMFSSESVVEVALVVPTSDGLGDWVDRLDHLVVSDGSFVQNAFAGVRAVSGERPVVVVTGDLPALTGEAIDDYVAQSAAAGADLTYPLVRKEDVLEQFPGSERTFVPIEGGPITGGNLVYADPDVLLSNGEFAQRMFDTRKSVVQWAMIVGPMFIARLISGNLRPADVEKKMAKITGAKRCRAIYTSYASIGADVDKPWDIPVAEKVILAREQAPS